MCFTEQEPSCFYLHLTTRFHGRLSGHLDTHRGLRSKSQEKLLALEARPRTRGYSASLKAKHFNDQKSHGSISRQKWLRHLRSWIGRVKVGFVSCCFEDSYLRKIDALHKSRLLNVEERPFKRITKRLLTNPSPISIQASRLPTPPPDTESETTGATPSARKDGQELRRFREDVQFDFSAFESSIARIQFVRASNTRERERYATEKLKIEANAQSVRDNTSQLRLQLTEAQTTLSIRKTYDELANKITSNKSLRPRDEQLLSLEKLRSEIEDLEREKQQYAQTWSERREQFSKLMEEGQRLRRLIRDEKEEVERREGMEDGQGEGEGEGEGEGDDADMMMTTGEGSTRGRSSLVGTPRPDGGQTPLHASGVGGSGALTPGRTATSTANGMESSMSNAPSPQRHEGQARADAEGKTPKAEDTGEDTDMIDEGEVEEDEESGGGGGNVPAVRVSEAGSGGKNGDTMDLT